jgi:multidrug efflux pump subunit AcrA (membrane-fusion protein)
LGDVGSHPEVVIPLQAEHEQLIKWRLAKDLTGADLLLGCIVVARRLRKTVSLGTCSIRVAGLFPNTGNLLRPGQYGRVRSTLKTKDGALLIPQRAVTELQGTYQVAVVDNGNKISIRNVKPSDRVGAQWIIDEGLKPGERVVAEGVQKVRPGMIVNPKPYAAPAEKVGK